MKCRVNVYDPSTVKQAYGANLGIENFGRPISTSKWSSGKLTSLMFTSTAALKKNHD